MGTALSFLLLSDLSNAALTAVNLTAAGSSTALNASFLIGKTLDDGFAYNPNNPTSTTPALGDGNGVPGFHGDASATHFIQYTFNPITTTSGQSTQFVVDLWGRTTNKDRDNNFTITLYNGNFATVIGSPSGTLSIPDAGSTYLRTTFNLSAGTTFDRFEIRATNTPFFTISETRAAFETIPEPSIALLGGIGALALLRRRRI